MTPAERDELNAKVAKLHGWRYADGYWHKEGYPPLLFLEDDYYGDARLWAPILELEIRADYYPYIENDRYIMTRRPTIDQEAEGDTLAEAVLRLFVALKGEV